MSTIEDQPPPKPTDRPAMWPEVIRYVEINYVDNDPEISNEKFREGTTVTQLVADMRERHALGIKRYGVPLTSGNGRNVLIDAYQEQLDFTVYLRAWLDEQDIEPVMPGAGRPIRDRPRDREPTPHELVAIHMYGMAIEMLLQLRGILSELSS